MFSAASGSTRRVRHTIICRYMDTRQAQKFISAIANGNIKTIRRRLSKKKCDINGLYRFEGSMEKMTALHYAAKEGMIDVLHELLAGGCDPTLITQFDLVTPLHFACQNVEHEVALMMSQELLHWGADPNSADHCYRTPLIIASEQGNVDLVHALLESGAEIDHHSAKEDYPLGIRWVREHMLLLPNKWVEEVCDPYEGNSALIQACREHHFLIVQELIKCGCSINCRNSGGNTPLHVACKSQSRHLFMDQLIHPAVVGHPGIVQLLIDHGSYLDPINKHGDTPLRRVISCMPEVNRQEIDNDTKLTAFLDAFHIMQLVVRAGSDLAICDASGDSVLHSLFQVRVKCSAMFDDILEARFTEVVRMLIMGGCPVKHRDRHIIEKSLNPTLRELLEWKLETPYTLKQISRLRIRQLLPKPVVHYVNKLELPGSLQKHLTLEVLD